MDWYYDGQSWVYADKQPEKKGPSIEQVKTAEKVKILVWWIHTWCEFKVKNLCCIEIGVVP